jgi:hypothetical protein
MDYPVYEDCLAHLALRAIQAKMESRSEIFTVMLN